MTKYALQVVNGPEVLNKYVGASEENIRNLFADAEKDQAVHGEASELHVIIFDEIDAICKARGSVGSGSGEQCIAMQNHRHMSAKPASGCWSTPSVCIRNASLLTFAIAWQKVAS